MNAVIDGAHSPSLSSVPLVGLRGLSMDFRTGGLLSRQVVRALRSVELDIFRGEIVALVGESGSGKSTIARCVARLQRPTSGSILLDGVDVLRSERRGASRSYRSKVQMVFQDPFGSLNPRLCAADLIGEPWLTHRGLVPAWQRAARVAELLEKVGLRASDASRHPHEFSGGQRQRIGIARALALEPEVIVCDEPVSALDLSVQAQVLNLLCDLRDELGLSYVFISHDLSVVRHLADRVAVMYLGKIVESGPTEEVYERPRHPYTEALLSAAPSPVAGGGRKRQRILLTGDIPSPADPPSGCRFRTRCRRVRDLCAVAVPAPPPGAPRHGAACHFPLEETPAVRA